MGDVVYGTRNESTGRDARKENDKVQSKVQGFQLEVTLNENVPRVRVCFADGTPVIDTDALSIQGMEHMGAVFERAAKMAHNELELYWQRKQAELRIGLTQGHK